MKNQVFSSNKSKDKYLYVTEKICCDKCSTELIVGQIIMVERCFKNRKSVQLHFCIDCGKHAFKYRGAGNSTFPVILINNLADLPEDCILVPATMSLNSGTAGTDVWLAAISNKGIESTTTGVKIIDKTLLAGRDANKVSKIGFKKRLKELDKPIEPDKEIKDFMKNIKKSKIIK